MLLLRMLVCPLVYFGVVPRSLGLDGAESALIPNIAF